MFRAIEERGSGLKPGRAGILRNGERVLVWHRDVWRGNVIVSSDGLLPRLGYVFVAALGCTVEMSLVWPMKIWRKDW